MSTRNDAFWHKPQQEMLNMCLSHSTPAINSDERFTLAAFTYVINGTINTSTAVAHGGGDTTKINVANYVGLLHSNNPVKTVTDDGSSSTRTILQNYAGLTVGAASRCWVILTIDDAADVSSQALTEAALHFYAGEVVTTSQTAKRPVLNLANECPIAECYVNNTTGAGSASDGAGIDAVMTWTPIAYINGV